MGKVFWSSLTPQKIYVWDGKFCQIHLPSLKLPLKMDGWNTTFLLRRLIFKGYVSFREGNFQFVEDIIGGSPQNASKWLDPIWHLWKWGVLYIVYSFFIYIIY